MKELPTINLMGKAYVQVKDRLLYFNETNPNGSITTEVKLNDQGSYARFKATVTPDVKVPDRIFIAHSAGQIDTEKSSEKLETVAVGRALAFMGIGVLESVTSADEIVKFDGQIKKFDGQKNDNPLSRSGEKVKKIKYSNTEPKEIIPEDALKPCDKCGGHFIIKSGRSGSFYGCSGYSKGCRRTIDLKDAEMWLKTSREISKEFGSDDDIAPAPEPPPFIE